jgi:hypothetical protein
MHKTLHGISKLGASAGVAAVSLGSSAELYHEDGYLTGCRPVVELSCMTKTCIWIYTYTCGVARSVLGPGCNRLVLGR